VKSKEMKTGCNLVEYTKEDYASKRAALPMKIMMMMNRMINECDAAGGMISDRRKRITRRNSAPVALLIHSD
jgi:hypothetical protein